MHNSGHAVVHGCKRCPASQEARAPQAVNSSILSNFWAFSMCGMLLIVDHLAVCHRTVTIPVTLFQLSLLLSDDFRDRCGYFYQSFLLFKGWLLISTIMFLGGERARICSGKKQLCVFGNLISCRLISKSSLSRQFVIYALCLLTILYIMSSTGLDRSLWEVGRFLNDQFVLLIMNIFQRGNSKQEDASS